MTNDKFSKIIGVAVAGYILHKLLIELFFVHLAWLVSKKGTANSQAILRQVEPSSLQFFASFSGRVGIDHYLPM